MLSTFFSRSQANVSALALSSAFVGGSLPALAVGDSLEPSNAGDVQQSPNLILGVGVGYANHFGKSYEVDVVSGASAPPIDGNRYSRSGFATNLFADFAIVDLGSGNLGLAAGFTVAAPDPFMNFAIEPRYRFRFPLTGSILRSLEPWGGLGLAFAFREKIDSNYYLWLPLSLGCDVGLVSKRLYAGVAVDLNTINPKGTRRGVIVSGVRHDYDARMDNIAVLVRLSYLVF